jgi:hypothetical protein
MVRAARGTSAIHVVGLDVLGWSDDEIQRRIAGIGETLTHIYADSDAHRITTVAAATRLAAQRLGDKAGRDDPTAGSLDRPPLSMTSRPNPAMSLTA